MISTYNQLTEEKQEERYINEEIDRDLFLRYKERFITERREIEAKLLQSDSRVSNLENVVEKMLLYATKLMSLWNLGGYIERQRIQF